MECSRTTLVKQESRSQSGKITVIPSSLKNDNNILSLLYSIDEKKKEKRCDVLLPDCLKGTYKNDYPIDKIDTFLKLHLARDRHIEIKCLETRLKELTTKIKAGKITVNKLRAIGEEIEQIQNKIEDTTQGSIKVNSYLEETSFLIKDFILVRRVKIKEFSETRDDLVEDEEVIEKRIKIIEQYILIARKYYPFVDVRRIVVVREECPVCSKEFEITENLLICVDCSVETEIVSNTVTHKDVDKVTIQSGDRENIDTFDRSLKKIQGIHPQKPPTSLYEELDKYFISRGRPDGNKIKSSPLNEETGKRGSVSIEELYSAIQRTQNNFWYPDLNWIAYEYWGWPLPDLGSIDSNIVEDYLTTSPHITEISHKYRKSGLGSVYHIYQLLMNRGFPCKRHHFFKMPTSEPISDEYETIWLEVCKRTGLKHFSIK
jgi:hypothetical protein